jgi:hypothetical protein
MRPSTLYLITTIVAAPSQMFACPMPPDQATDVPVTASNSGADAQETAAKQLLHGSRAEPAHSSAPRRAGRMAKTGK